MIPHLATLTLAFMALTGTASALPDPTNNLRHGAIKVLSFYKNGNCNGNHGTTIARNISLNALDNTACGNNCRHLTDDPRLDLTGNGAVGSVGFADSSLSAKLNNQVVCFFYSTDDNQCKAIRPPHSITSEPGNCLPVNLTDTPNVRCNGFSDLSRVACPSTTTSTDGVNVINTLSSSPFASIIPSSF